MSSVLVTGGSGFVGRSLVPMLAKNGYSVRTTCRDLVSLSGEWRKSDINWVEFNLENKHEDYSALMKDIDIVIHVAGQAHITRKDEQTLKSFRKVNVDGTRKLATEANAAGVKQFIFISTIKVFGERSVLTANGNVHRFTENDIPEPVGLYAMSKFEAEQAIQDICNKNNQMQYLILRPPLIYGPHVKANFLRLINLVSKGIPLPFASIDNKRSLLYVDNLNQVILAALARPEAIRNNTYVVSDVDVSLPQLIREISGHFDKKTKLFSLPVPLLHLAGYLTGRKLLIDRLVESLLVDSTKITQELGWIPEVNFEDGIRNTIEWYKKQQQQPENIIRKL